MRSINQHAHNDPGEYRQGQLFYEENRDNNADRTGNLTNKIGFEVESAFL